jgi:hypothetical protein
MKKILPCLLAGALTVSSVGLANEVPLPRPRPLIAKLPATAPALPPAAAAQARWVNPLLDKAGATPCTDLLAEGIAVAELTHAVSGNSGGAGCGDEAPVRLTAIRLADGRMAELRPHALLRCEMALAFARWVRDDLAPTVALSEAPLSRIDIAASYSCRPRNNSNGARLSEHGHANAVDVGAIGLADGRKIAIESVDAPAILLAAMRWSACSRFTTVLGPGSDRAHESHIHLDLARRRGGYRLCQWILPPWPEP